MAPLKIIFAVQGEGRGHMTQTITLQNLLLAAGHDVCEVMVGTSSERQLPDFFYKQIKAPIYKFDSPNFITDARHKSIRIVPSVLRTIGLLPLYIRNMRTIHKRIREEKPDLVINFYDPLIGLYYLIFNPKVPMVCVAHQYTFLHKDFKFPARGFFMAKLALKVFTWLTAARAAKKLALSMYPMANEQGKNLWVIPPLLRRDVFNATATEGDYILVYLLNQGYMDDIIAWHKKHPEVKLHCFTDKKEIEETWQYDDTLAFHQINDKKFLELMAGCKAFASTAGFESICEAMYLGKPVFMVPVENHFEQYSNARDAARAGAGIYDNAFNLDKLLEYLPAYRQNAKYQEWVQQTASIILGHIETAVQPDAGMQQSKALAGQYANYR